jgi:peptide-methionine (S)-S-oxide reductase
MSNDEVAIFGGGCFWCTEAVYDSLHGVKSVESGYAGGHVENPTYRQVCGGDTGHAEVVRITFDPAVISFRDLLDVFFTVHDPTTLNRQGNDLGTQYRSVIFYTSEEQRRQAEEAIRNLNASGTLPGPVVTALEAAGKFFMAEDYHQEYFVNNPSQPYCLMTIPPKLKKLREKFAARVKAS